MSDPLDQFVNARAAQLDAESSARALRHSMNQELVESFLLRAEGRGLEVASGGPQAPWADRGWYFRQVSPEGSQARFFIREDGMIFREAWDEYADPVLTQNNFRPREPTDLHGYASERLGPALAEILRNIRDAAPDPARDQSIPEGLRVVGFQDRAGGNEAPNRHAIADFLAYMPSPTVRIYDPTSHPHIKGELSPDNYREERRVRKGLLRREASERFAPDWPVWHGWHLPPNRDSRFFVRTPDGQMFAGGLSVELSCIESRKLRRVLTETLLLAREWWDLEAGDVVVHGNYGACLAISLNLDRGTVTLDVPRDGHHTFDLGLAPLRRQRNA